MGKLLGVGSFRSAATFTFSQATFGMTETWQLLEFAVSSEKMEETFLQTEANS